MWLLIEYLYLFTDSRMTLWISSAAEQMINLIKQKHHSSISHKNNAITEWAIVVDEDKKLANRVWWMAGEAGRAGRAGVRGFRVPLKGQVIETPTTEKLTLLAEIGQVIMRQHKL